MTNRERRLRNLETRWTDQSGFVPHTSEWLAYWKRQFRLYVAGQMPEGIRFSLQAIRAVIRNTDDSEIDEWTGEPSGG